jgi:hypothetical protein
MVTVRNGQERSGTVGTVRNGQERSGMVRNWSGTVRNGQERSGTVRNGQERSGTVMVTVRDGERYETIILYKINGQKLLQNHVHGAFTVRSRTSRSRFKNERITVQFTKLNLIFFELQIKLLWQS